MEDHAFQQVLALAEHLNADVFQEPIASRWSFPRRHKLFRGALLPAQRPLAEQLAGYDTVVVLGAPVFLYYSYVPGDPIRPDTKLISDHQFTCGCRRRAGRRQHRRQSLLPRRISAEAYSATPDANSCFA